MTENGIDSKYSGDWVWGMRTWVGSMSQALWLYIRLFVCSLSITQRPPRDKRGHVSEARSGVGASRERSPSGWIFFLIGNPRKSAMQHGAWGPMALVSKSRFPHSGCMQCSSLEAYCVSDTVPGASTPSHPNTMSDSPCFYHQPRSIVNK